MSLDDADRGRYLDTPTGESRAALLLDAVATIATIRGASRAEVDQGVSRLLLGNASPQETPASPLVIEAKWEQV